MISSRRIVSSVFSTDFRKSCQIISENIPKLRPNNVLVKTRYVGVNASDVNVVAGRYGKIDIGMEGVGEIVEVGKKVDQSMIGRAVGYISSGCFAEYMTLPSKSCILLPAAQPEYVPMLISGLTASISLEETGGMTSGKKVFITAAAGGTGHIAVQIAKKAGCHVIGTCSNEEKTELLEAIGCDHIINYKTENLSDVLKKKYANKLDIVYESVGGDIFDTCFNNLAVRGKMIVIGHVSSYNTPDGADSSHHNAAMVSKLIMKSACINGFFLVNHRPAYQSHFEKLLSMYNNGELRIFTNQFDVNGNKFSGLESVFDAVEHLYSQNSVGKVIVEV